MKNLTSDSLWRVFVKRYQLNDVQESQFRQYMHALEQWEEFGNITAITDERAIIELHFEDSLALTKFVDFSQINSIADVGSGGGFPGIPLAIKFPNLHVYLIEVSHKKIMFLERLIQELHLTNITIIPLDWRTFLRKTSHDIALCCARASLAVTELVRMFKPSSPYKHAQLVYWASYDWQAPKQVAPLIKEQWQYHVGGRERRLILLQLNLLDDLGGGD